MSLGKQPSTVEMDLDSTQARRDRFQVRTDLAREAAELAYAFVEVSRERGTPGMVAEAVVTYIEQQLMQTFFALLQAQTDGALDVKLWEMVVKLAGMLVKNRETLVAIEKMLRSISPQAQKKEASDTWLRVRRELGIDESLVREDPLPSVCPAEI